MRKKYPTCPFISPFKLQILSYLLCIFSFFNSFAYVPQGEGLPLYYWQQKEFVNFGDYISLKLVERIVNAPVRVYRKNLKAPEKKLLAIGSILWFANENDVLWGTGYNGKRDDFNFTWLDVRAVRGPLTRDLLITRFNIQTPEIYGDPALLFPYFFPEFKKPANPSQDYIVIPHYKELSIFPRSPSIVYPTDPWDEVINKILDSKFVISSSLHGIIIAEAYGIPARLLKVSDHEPIFKYDDYYQGTNRPNYQAAHSIEEALLLGGEKPFECDLEKLYDAFPMEFWPNTHFIKPNFSQKIAYETD